MLDYSLTYLGASRSILDLAAYAGKQTEGRNPYELLGPAALYRLPSGDTHQTPLSPYGELVQ